MDKLKPLQPRDPEDLWDEMTSYQAIEKTWRNLDETRKAVNDAMDVIESDILSNDYAAVKALEAAGEAKEAAVAAYDAVEKVSGIGDVSALLNQIAEINNKCDANAENLEAETERAESAEGELSAAIDATKSELLTAIGAEKTRAMGAEEALEGSISDEAERAKAAEQSLRETKQNVISDLTTIRQGASAGATAVQPSAISDMETKTHAGDTYQTKGDYALRGESYTKQESDAKYLTEHQPLDGKADLSYVDSVKTELDGVKNTAEQAELIARGRATSKVFDTLYDMTVWISNPANKGVLKRGDNLYIKAKLEPDYWVVDALDEPNSKGYYYTYSELETEKVDVSDMPKVEDLADVAYSGDYRDLVNKPAIPAEVTEHTVANWGFSKTTGTYSKPSAGIPKTDLEQSVQTSLGKADSAVQPSEVEDMETKTHAAATYQPVGDYYTKPTGGIPGTDMTSEVQASLAKADNAVQTNVAEGVSKTGDLYHIKDVNGNELLIPQASVAAMVADAIKASAPLQGKVTFGATTAAEMASVVAQHINPIACPNSYFEGNIDALVSNGVYRLSSETTGTFPNAQSRVYAILEVMAGNADTNKNNVTQRYTNRYGCVFIRNNEGGSFNDWIRIDNFGAKTEAELASVVAGAMRHSITNLTNVNAIVNDGVYPFYNISSDGIPDTSGGVLRVTNTGSYPIIQEALYHSRGGYIRLCWGSPNNANSWSTWKQIYAVGD